MKNSKEYSQKINKLYSSLKRKYPKVKKVIYDNPIDALIYAIVSENMNKTAAKSAVKKLAGHFIDWNDLRVSQSEEIVEALGTDSPVTRDIALAVTRMLKAVFNKYNTVSLDELKKISKRPAKQILEKIDGAGRFAVNYCILTSLQGHAIPLTGKMIEYLRGNQLVHEDADEQQIEGFLARQILADKAYEFYTLLRNESEAYKAKQKKKTVTKKKTKTKTKTKTKKKTKKKKTKTKK